MTDNEINAAIAGSLGWKRNLLYSSGWFRGPSFLRRTELTYNLPDYTADLNAMHEAEEKLRNDFGPVSWPAYWLSLVEVCKPSREYWRATARQRAEAFLRVKGLWVEGGKTET